MPLSKPEIVQHGAHRAGQTLPNERVWVVFQASYGEWGDTVGWLSILVRPLSYIEDLRARLFTVVLTDSSVLLIRTGRIFFAVKKVKYSFARQEFRNHVTDVKWDGLGAAEFSLKLPGKRRQKKMRVGVEWKDEVHYLLTQLSPEQQRHAGHGYPGQSSSAAPLPQPGDPQQPGYGQRQEPSQGYGQAGYGPGRGPGPYR